MDDRSIDLHAHTTASDGDHTPTELVRHAAEIGLTAIAVTDHDTTEGIAEAQEAGARYGVEVVPGIELSAAFENGQCHLLGFCIDPAAPALLARLEAVRKNRAVRNAGMGEKLRALGIDITEQDVETAAGGEVVGRPHFARVLVEKGYVGSVREAFERYLAKGAAAYVERDRLQPDEAIALIHDAGGVAILAHPGYLRRDAVGTAAEIAHLQTLGLDGIEARYSQHTPEETARYLELAYSRGLLTSGGSDYHGPTVKPDVHLGHVEGNLPAPNILLDALRQAAEKISR